MTNGDMAVNARLLFAHPDISPSKEAKAYRFGKTKTVTLHSDTLQEKKLRARAGVIGACGTDPFEKLRSISRLNYSIASLWGRQGQL